MKHKLTKKQNIKVLTGLSSLSFLAILCCASNVLASSVVDEFTVTVPESCSLTSTVDTAHTATIENGVYSDDVGETTINAFCNDSEGFSVYAVGYTDDTFGNNTMKPSTLADTKAIATGLATSGDTSNWAMKLTSLSDNYTLTNDFNAYHLVPDEYTKVATYPSNTTTTAGVNIKSTYAAYISQTQPADTYTGKVKYTIVHPASAVAEKPIALLDTGEKVCVKMKKIANNSSYESKWTSNSNIKAFRPSNTLPNGFVATTDNTISLATSSTPVYIFFDNTDSAGIMYYYVEDDAELIANPDSSYMFSTMASLADFAGLSDLDTTRVTSMTYMFYSTSITSLESLAPNKNNNPNIWNTGNVENMSQMFTGCSLLTNIAGISNWDTAKVTNMSYMFSNTKITSLDALAPNKNNNPNIWNTGNVTDMSGMFKNCSSLMNIAGIANWDVSKVTATAGSASYDANNFYYMFQEVSSTTTSGFSFTNRAGSINSDGTYVTSS